MPATPVYSILLKKEKAHEDPIYCCAWTKVNTGDSKDHGKDFIVTGGLDGLIKVWTLEDNKLVLQHTLQEHAIAIVSIAVSPDGHTLASASLDSSLVIWDLVSGNKVYEVQTGATDVWKVAFSPNGSQLVTGSHMGKVYIYGVEKGVVNKVLDTRGKFAISVAWSPNGKLIATGSVDGKLCLFDVAQGNLLHMVEAHTNIIRNIEFSFNSKLICSVSDDGKAKIYNVTSAGVESTLEHKCWVLSASFSRDGSRVATAAVDGTVRVAAVDKLTILNIFQEHSAAVSDLQFNFESNKLLSVSKDKCINVYECPVPPKNTAAK